MYYFPYVQQRNWSRPIFGYDYRQYKPVKAYTVDRPVYVNNEDINKFPYQALNYQPAGVQYPYVYVPIAQFSKVGAQVKWDEQTQTLSVTTDYFKIRDELASCKEELKGCIKPDYQALTDEIFQATSKYYPNDIKGIRFDEYTLSGKLIQRYLMDLGLNTDTSKIMDDTRVTSEIERISGRKVQVIFGGRVIEYRFVQ